MAIVQRLNRVDGITLIVVTHDSDIASYSNRTVHFRDGVIQRDERIAKPREAKEDLEQMPAEAELELVVA